MVSLYPITIVQARYQGVYEGGQWLAFNQHPENIPHDAFADDVTCATWWRSGDAAMVGIGRTPDAAVGHLLDLHGKAKVIDGD